MTPIMSILNTATCYGHLAFGTLKEPAIRGTTPSRSTITRPSQPKRARSSSHCLTASIRYCDAAAVRTSRMPTHSVNGVLHHRLQLPNGIFATVPLARSPRHSASSGPLVATLIQVIITPASSPYSLSWRRVRDNMAPAAVLIESVAAQWKYPYPRSPRPPHEEGVRDRYTGCSNRSTLREIVR
jgi:hypothetical protein